METALPVHCSDRFQNFGGFYLKIIKKNWIFCVFLKLGNLAIFELRGCEKFWFFTDFSMIFQ